MQVVVTCLIRSVSLGGRFRVGSFRRIGGIVFLVCGMASFMFVPPRANAEIEDGLMAYWDFDGDLADKAGGLGSTADTTSDNGTFIGSPGSADFGTGQFGQGLDLDGEDGWVEVPTSSDLEAAGEDLSISTWFRVDAFDTGWQALVSKGESQNYRVARRGSEATNEMSYAGGNPGGADIFGGPDVLDQQWHHLVAITNNAGPMQLWIDGAMVAERPGPDNVLIDTGQPLFIGNNPEALGREWEGGIDDMAIWNRPITPLEIEAIYNGGTGRTIAEVADVTLLSGDFNGDGEITAADFMILSDNLGRHLDDLPVGREHGDMNFDQMIDLEDFGAFKEAFPGAFAAATGVPEPSTIGLVACVLAVLALRPLRKRGGRPVVE